MRGARAVVVTWIEDALHLGRLRLPCARYRRRCVTWATWCATRESAAWPRRCRRRSSGIAAATFPWKRRRATDDCWLVVVRAVRESVRQFPVRRHRRRRPSSSVVVRHRRRRRCRCSAWCCFRLIADAIRVAPGFTSTTAPDRRPCSGEILFPLFPSPSPAVLLYC